MNRRIGDLTRSPFRKSALFCLLTIALTGAAWGQVFTGSVTESSFCDLPGTFCCNQCSLADPLNLSITGADPAASGDATVTLEIRGDVNDLDEILLVTVEGFSLGTILNNNLGDDLFDHPTDVGTDCGASYFAQATIPLSDLTSIVADGQIDTNLRPDQENNDIEGCLDPREFVTLTVEYPVGGVPTVPKIGLLVLAAALLTLAAYRLWQGDAKARVR